MTRMRPALTASGIDARSYRAYFERDLAQVVAAEGGPYARISVASFCPDFPDVAIYAGPGHAFHSLADSCWFLCAFFATQLADQAAHSVLGKVERNRAGTQGNLVLVGLLGSYWQVIEPAFLLLALGLYDLPVPVGTITDGIRTLVAAEFDEFRSDSDGSRILAAATASLTHIPASLRAFVSHGDAYEWQPDSVLVDAFRKSALAGLPRPAV